MAKMNVTAKNVRCDKCHKWIPVPGWVKTQSKPVYGSMATTKDVVIKCPSCKSYVDVVITI